MSEQKEFELTNKQIDRFYHRLGREGGIDRFYYRFQRSNMTYETKNIIFLAMRVKVSSDS